MASTITQFRRWAESGLLSVLFVALLPSAMAADALRAGLVALGTSQSVAKRIAASAGKLAAIFTILTSLTTFAYLEYHLSPPADISGLSIELIANYSWRGIVTMMLKSLGGTILSAMLGLHKLCSTVVWLWSCAPVCSTMYLAAASLYYAGE